jgi:flavin reductase (DIM6/NTAB) family NADH-FMN oxidoreductase RutF
VGDHVLFLGLVEAFEHRHGAGLLYCQGRYAQGVGLEAPDAAPAPSPLPLPPRRPT